MCPAQEGVGACEDMRAAEERGGPGAKVSRWQEEGAFALGFCGYKTQEAAGSC